jgi:hypothetical protein
MIVRNHEKFLAVRRLWTACITLACQDAASNDAERATAAEKWLTSSDAELAFRGAGLNQGAFCEGLQRALGNRRKMLAVLAEKCPVDNNPQPERLPVAA